LENSNLSEAHVLKALSKVKLLPRIAEAVAQHRKWSSSYNVRLALVRQPAATLSTVLAFLPEITVSDLKELVTPVSSRKTFAVIYKLKSSGESAAQRNK